METIDRFLRDNVYSPTLGGFEPMYGVDPIQGFYESMSFEQRVHMNTLEEIVAVARLAKYGAAEVKMAQIKDAFTGGLV